MKTISSALANEVWETVTITSSLVTNTTVTAKRRREGDSARYRVFVSFSGAPDAGELTLTLPAGDVIDTTKLPGGTSPNQNLGFGNYKDATANRYPTIDVWYLSTTTVYVLSGTYTAVPNTLEVNGTQAIALIASGDSIYCEFLVPLVQ